MLVRTILVAAGTWFWIDPENDVTFAGMIQRVVMSGSPDLESKSRRAVYQALLHPEK